MTQNDADQIVLSTIRQIIRATTLHSKQLAKTTGLTAPQLIVLKTVREHAELSISRLADLVSLSQATVTTIVNRLEQRALLQRRRSEKDRRVVKVALTPSGTEISDRAPTPLQEQFTERFANLAEWEQSMIIAALQRVALLMNAESLDASPVLHVDATATAAGSDVTDEPGAT